VVSRSIFPCASRLFLFFDLSSSRFLKEKKSLRLTSLFTKPSLDRYPKNNEGLRCTPEKFGVPGIEKIYCNK